jgi:quinol-cytochrome oxidoreductase complex cytochrome b subunit
VRERRSLLRRILASWDPRTPREASDAVVRNFLLHALPARVTLRSFSWRASAWLGTVTLSLFLILCGTGAVLLLHYTPSVERAYASVKDLEFAVPFGGWIRAVHRVAAHGMVIAVVAHLVRVFLTGAYKKEGAPGATRPLNWLVGLGLLLATLGLSFTGYLLPWDQLAYWAATVGTKVARAIPLVGEDVHRLLIGGTEIGQPTLIRFYALHGFVLPAIAVFLTSYHLWRIRKDGGLAVADRALDEARERAVAGPPAPGKTYALLGVTQGDTVASVSPAAWIEKVSVPGVPNLVRRTAIVFLMTAAVVGALGLVMPAPLEQPADPLLTPNPAKAPWYFLWLQELLTDLTIRIGPLAIDGALLGGLVVPGLLFLLLAVWPWLDRSPREAAGVWFHPTRRRQIAAFLVLLAAVGVLIAIGALFRGPHWSWTWPWERAPALPTRF